MTEKSTQDINREITKPSYLEQAQEKMGKEVVKLYEQVRSIFNGLTKRKEKLSRQEVELVQNSKTLIEAFNNDELPKTATDLVDGVFMMGSTNVDWRSGQVIDAFTEAGIVNYNPDMGSDWDESYIQAEALGMSEFSTLAMRIEVGAVDGSLGSLAEIGMALFSARVNGQELIISIAEGFEDTLDDPAAIAQYQAIMDYLGHVSDRDNITVLVDSSREDYVDAVKSSVERQRNPEKAVKPLSRDEIVDFAEKRRRRMHNKNKKVVFGGSSGSAFGKDSQITERFERKQYELSKPWKEDPQNIFMALNEPPFSTQWDGIYSGDEDYDTPEEKSLAMQRAFFIESGVKTEADVLVWQVLSESKSLAAATESGTLLHNMIDTGQLMVLLIEEFGYVDQLLAQELAKEGPFDQIKQEAQARFDEAESMLKLRNSETGEEIDEELKIKLEKMKVEAQQVLQLLDDIDNDPDAVTMSRLKQQAPALKKSISFRQVDNTRRVRAIAQEQLLRIQEKAKKISGDNAIELFVMATDKDSLEQKQALVSNPETFDEREQYFVNFEEFINNIEETLQRSPEKFTKSQMVEVITGTLKNRFTDEELEKVKGLFSHLEAVQEATLFLGDLLQNNSESNDGQYLSSEKVTLLVDVVAPLHDVFKLLGGPHVQSMPDHEQAAEYVIRRFGKAFGYDDEEIDFIAEVIGDHENIFKEKNRDKFADSKDDKEKAKALFFLADTLTGALKLNDNEELTIDPELLKARFTDLYFRHIDPVEGKIFRPQWGVDTLKDYISTFDTLQEKYGVKVDPGLINQLVDAALTAIDMAREAQDNRSQDDERNLSKRELTDVVLLRSQIASLKH
jgi:hypothetical protein